MQQNNQIQLLRTGPGTQSMLFFVEGNKLFSSRSNQIPTGGLYPLDALSVVYEGDILGFSAVFHDTGQIECAVQTGERQFIVRLSNDWARTWEPS